MIYDTNGQIIHDENEDFVAPQNSPDLLFCEVTVSDKSWNCLEDACVELSDDTGNFSSLSECQELCGTSSIDENGIELSIYPNPSSGLFNIQFNFDEGVVELLVTNILGNKVYSSSLNTQEQNNILIDLSNYPQGIYNLTLKTTMEIKTYKLVFSN